MAFEALNRLLEGVIDAIKKVDFRVTRLERFVRDDSIQRFSEIAIGYVLGQSTTQSYSKFAIDVCIPDLKEKRVIAYPLSILNGFIMPDPYTLVLVLKDRTGKYFYLGNAIGLDETYLNSYVSKIVDSDEKTGGKVGTFKIQTLESKFKEIYDLIFKNFVPYDKLDSDLIDLLLIHPMFKPEFAISYNKTTKNLIHFYKNWLRVSHVFYDNGIIDFSVIDHSKSLEKILPKLMFNIDVGSGYFQVKGQYVSLLIDNIIPVDETIPKEEKLKYIGFKYRDVANHNSFEMHRNEILLERRHTGNVNAPSNKLHIKHDENIEESNKGEIELIVNSNDNLKEAGLNIQESGTIILYNRGNKQGDIDNVNSSFIQLLKQSGAPNKIILNVDGLSIEMIKGSNDSHISIYDSNMNFLVDIDFYNGKIFIHNFYEVFIGDNRNKVDKLTVVASQKVSVDAAMEIFLKADQINLQANQITLQASQINFQGQVAVSGAISCNSTLETTGDLTASSNMNCGGDINCNGDITCAGDLTCAGTISGNDIQASGDVIAGSISLKNHTHFVGGLGTNTSPPM